MSPRRFATHWGAPFMMLALLLAAARAEAQLAAPGPFSPESPMSGGVFQVTPTCNGVALSWSSIGSATAYSIRRSGAADTVVTGTSMIDHVVPGTCRTYSLASISSSGQVSAYGAASRLTCAVDGSPSGLSLGPARATFTATTVEFVLTGYWGPQSPFVSLPKFRWYQGNVLRATTDAPHWAITTQLSDDGDYRCDVQNACGTGSASTTLHVVDPPAAPEVVTAASACSTVVVQWAAVQGVTRYMVERNPSFLTLDPLQLPWRIIDGTTFTDTLFFALPNDPKASYTYFVHSMVYDSLFGPGGPGAVPVSPATNPLISEQPSGGRYEAGTTVLLTCLYGPANATVIWRKNGVPLDPPPPLLSELVLPAAGPADSGTYDALVTTLCGTVTSAPAVVQVCRTPSVTGGGRRLGAEIGTPLVTLATDAQSGDSLRWFKDGVILADGGRISGATTKNLGIANVVSADAGYYEVRAYGTCETVTGPRIQLWTATCLGDPIISENLPQNQIVTLGAPASLHVTATSCKDLSYSWYHWAGGNASLVQAGSESTLYLGNVSGASLGYYWCWIQGRTGARSDDVYLSLLPEPSLKWSLRDVCAPYVSMDWTTDMPCVVTANYGGWGSCAMLFQPPFYTSPLATSGTVLVKSDYYSFALTATNLSNVSHRTACMNWYAPPSVAYGLPSAAGASYYKWVNGGWALPVTVSLFDYGCTAISGPITLTAASLANAGAPVLASGAPALPLKLSYASVGAQEVKDFATIYFPVAIPSANTTRVLTVTVSAPAAYNPSSTIKTVVTLPGGNP
jgi:hypothetical protein